MVDIKRIEVGSINRQLNESRQAIKRRNDLANRENILIFASRNRREAIDYDCSSSGIKRISIHSFGDNS